MQGLKWTLAALLLGSPFALAAAPRWTVSTVQGIKLKIPAGWKVSRSQPGLILLLDPNKVNDADTAMLLVWSAQPATIDAGRMSEQTIAGLFGDDHSYGLIGQSTEQGVLSRLYLDTEPNGRFYISTAASPGDATRQKGYWLTLFAAPEKRFNELGGAMFPFAVLGKVSDAALEQSVAQARKNAVNMQFASAPTTTSGSSSDPNCGQYNYGSDSLGTAFTTIANSTCKDDPHLQTIGSLLQASANKAFDQYEAAMVRYNAAWDRYEQRMTELCDGRSARTPADLTRLQQICSAAVNATSNSLNSWHQTNKGILYNMSFTPWCYADKNGNCR